MHGKLAMGMLCHSRPVHTALTLAFAIVNKSPHTDLYSVYGFCKGDEPKSPVLTTLLLEMEKFGIPIIYRTPGYPSNTMGGIDTLMRSLDQMQGYDCYFKIDDDVLIGHGTDIIMADILLGLEQDNVYMLMAQAVPAHIRERVPFCWEANINDYRVVERSNKVCPMETYTAVSYKALQLMRDHGISDSCDNSRGVYGYYVRKLVNLGARTALVLTPTITMQHIGLTTTIEPGNPPRIWAPARKWEPRNEVIQLPYFDFYEWEASHKTNTQKEVAIATITKLKASSNVEHHAVLSKILEVLETYKQKPDDIPDPAKCKRQRRTPRIIRQGMVTQPDVQVVVRSRNTCNAVTGRTPHASKRDQVVKLARPAKKVVVRKP